MVAGVVALGIGHGGGTGNGSSFCMTCIMATFPNPSLVAGCMDHKV